MIIIIIIIIILRDYYYFIKGVDATICREAYRLWLYLVEPVTQGEQQRPLRLGPHHLLAGIAEASQPTQPHA
jgi:hypothetical protein